MQNLSRRGYLATAGAAATALAGCTGSDDGTNPLSDAAEDDTDAGGADDTAGGSDGDDGSGGGDSGSDSYVFPTADERLTLPLSPGEIREAAQSGGPPKDGIPSIDEPKFIGPGEAEFLKPGDPVFGVVRNGVTKAYPQKILVSHEIVNDTLGDENVSVTYCPLTGTVQGFKRGDTTFGVSGRLINNNLVMYDRQTEAWWPQILATSIPGPWNQNTTIASLEEFRLIWTTWEKWRNQHPDTQVLSQDTGHARNYSNDPYGSYNPIGGYYEDSSTLFPSLHEDDSFPTKEVFMGARTAEGAVAFKKDTILNERLMTGTLGSTPVVAVHDDRYETAYVYLNPEEASFEMDGTKVVDADGTAHLPDELPLDRVHTFDAMWMAWAGYYPDTNVVA